jgi:hypothetical protein
MSLSSLTHLVEEGIERTEDTIIGLSFDPLFSIFPGILTSS